MEWSTWPNGGQVPIIDEFAAGHNDDCGPNAQENLMATIQRRTPSATEMNAIRSYAIAQGHFTNGSGENIHGVLADYEGYWKIAPGSLALAPYLPNFAPFSLAQIEALCATITSDSQGGITVELYNAGALPHNQPGVQGHFIDILGYNSVTTTVKVANGDTVNPRLETSYDVTLAELEAAHVIAAITVHLASPAPVETFTCARVENGALVLGTAHGTFVPLGG